MNQKRSFYAQKVASFEEILQRNTIFLQREML